MAVMLVLDLLKISFNVSFDHFAEIEPFEARVQVSGPLSLPPKHEARPIRRRQKVSSTRTTISATRATTSTTTTTTTTTT